VVIESGRLTPLTGQEDYLEKLSAVVGVRLCNPEEGREASSRLTLLEAEPLAVSVGIAALKKKGESVSGDKGSYFKTDAGVLCVILADGMGTGDEAAKDSARVVGILEKFLRSGVDPAAAMKILNSVLLLTYSSHSIMQMMHVQLLFYSVFSHLLVSFLMQLLRQRHA
jgi:stage II sporulation protein E